MTLDYISTALATACGSLPALEIRLSEFVIALAPHAQVIDIALLISRNETVVDLIAHQSGLGQQRPEPDSDTFVFDQDARLRKDLRSPGMRRRSLVGRRKALVAKEISALHIA